MNQTIRTREAMIDNLRHLDGRARTRAAEVAIVERYTDDDDDEDGDIGPFGIPAGDWLGVD